ncbi:MAG: DNA polymerase Y family protein [Pseudomonadota bacterium]
MRLQARMALNRMDQPRPFWEVDETQSERAVAGGDHPLVLVQYGVRGTRLTACSLEALDAGVRVGQMLTDARAACPLLRVESADPEGDEDMLQRLALWCSRYTPITALDTSHPDTDACGRDFGLFLDTSGCDHLFGGEPALLADCQRRLAAMGFTARLAIAPTPAAAHALARYGADRTIVPDADIKPDDATSLLAPLPVDALRLDGERVTLLRRLGLKTVHSVARVPRQALERRFRARSDAAHVQLRVDQMSGAIHEPLAPMRLPAPWRTHMPCPEPALDIAAIRFALTHLLEQLCARLEEAGLGAQGWRFTAYHADGGASSVSVRLSQAGRVQAHILRLFEDKLERIDPGYGIDAFVLEAGDCAPLAAPQTSMVHHGQEEDEALSVELCGLVDRLTNRFGERSITRALPLRSHVPERAWRMVPASQAMMTGRSAHGVAHWASRGAAAPLRWEEVAAQTVFRTTNRPFRLFDQPEEAQVLAQVPDGPPLAFTWRRITRRIARARGPERIAPEWWRDGSRGTVIRDYYEVEDLEGRRYWLFRKGTYGNENAPPLWFVHGVFG